MANINPSSPADTDIVSAYPANERASRSALLELTAGDAFWGGTSAGSANAQTVTVANTGLTLRAGLTIHFIAGFNNTAINPTLTVNALAPMIVKDKDGNNLGATGAIKLNRQHTAVFDGTNFRLQDPADWVSQASYDAMLPVGFVQLRWDGTAPVVPSGVTATWTAITDTDRYLRINNAGGGGSGGSATTTLPAHTHSSGSLIATGSASDTTQVPASPDQVTVPTETANWEVTGATGPIVNPSPDVDITPKFRDVRAYRRSA